MDQEKKPRTTMLLESKLTRPRRREILAKPGGLVIVEFDEGEKEDQKETLKRRSRNATAQKGAENVRET